ncbi:MAG: hypothetical protein ACRC9L_05880 [Brevinema sp.]
MSEVSRLHGCNRGTEELGKSGNTLSYTKLCKIEQVRHGKGFIIEGQTQRNESLVNALKQAWEWNDWIAEGKIGSVIELAEKLKITRRYVERILNMRYLSPKIQLMILKGTQPISWTTHTFIKVLPSNWEEQSRELNL